MTTVKHFCSFVIRVALIGYNPSTMIRIKLRQLLDDKAFVEGRRITLNEVSAATGIARATMTRIANKPGYSTTTDNVDALCRYFECEPGELLEFVDKAPTRKG